jgi:lipopolysaccharide/colanic/teichoic acid biosynthesis glycosyltransferase
MGSELWFRPNSSGKRFHHIKVLTSRHFAENVELSDFWYWTLSERILSAGRCTAATQL